MNQRMQQAVSIGRSVEQSRPSGDFVDEVIAKTSAPSDSKAYREEYNKGYEEGEADYPGHERISRYVLTSYAYDLGYDKGWAAAKKKKQSDMDSLSQLGTGISSLFRSSTSSPPSTSTTRQASSSPVETVQPVALVSAARPMVQVVSFREPQRTADEPAPKETSKSMNPALVMGLAIGGGVLAGGIVLLAYRSMRRR